MRVVNLVVILCTVAAVASALNKEERIRQEYEKKLAEQDKKLAEQEVKHERSLKAASEIEDSLRAEVERLKDSQTDYIKLAKDTATNAAEVTKKALDDATVVSQEYLKYAGEKTVETYENTVKPGMEDLMKQTNDLVKPHVDNIMPSVEPVLKQTQKTLNTYFTKLVIAYETYRVRFVNVLAAQPNITSAGAEYMVDLIAWSIVFMFVYYLIFPAAKYAVLRSLQCVTCGFCCCSMCLSSTKGKRRKKKRQYNR